MLLFIFNEISVKHGYNASIWIDLFYGYMVDLISTAIQM